MVNKKIAENRAAGLMQPPGEALVQIAKENGMWSFWTMLSGSKCPTILLRRLVTIVLFGMPIRATFSVEHRMDQDRQET